MPRSAVSLVISGSEGHTVFAEAVRDWGEAGREGRLRGDWTAVGARRKREHRAGVYLLGKHP